MLTRGIVYLADHSLPADITESCQRQLLHSGLYILSVSLAPLDFGDNIVLGLEPGPFTVFKQILMGVSNLQEDVAFICGAGWAYHPSHFDFTPPRNDIFYYNRNAWAVCAETGRRLFQGQKMVSQLCADTRLLINHYGDRIKRIEERRLYSQEDLLRMGLEPGAKRISQGGVDDHSSDIWFSSGPNVTRTLKEGRVL